jgi:hypothetical protein
MDAHERLGKIVGHRRAEKSAAHGTHFYSPAHQDWTEIFSG